MLNNLDEVIEKSFLIERHHDKYVGTKRASQNLLGVHVLTSLLDNNNTLIPAQMEVKELKGQDNVLYITLAVGEIKKTAILGNRSDMFPTLSKLKLNQIFQNVNSNDIDFLKYIPNQFLNDEQIAGKKKGIEKEKEKIAKLATNEKDSTGRKITKGQQEFFKDSKVRDEDGNLLVVYHGTDQNFTVFDRTKGRSTMDIQGSFFSPWEEDAGGYGPNV